MGERDITVGKDVVASEPARTVHDDAPRHRLLAAGTGRGPFSFALLAVILGGVAGLGAFAFRTLIGLFHNLFFLRKLSFFYDSNVHTPPSPWGWAVMGATLGSAYGLALRRLLPGLHVDPTAFALAGMAGLVAGGTGAALTAIVMIFEMTRDYSVVLPMTLTVAVSHGLRRLLLRESIYTMKLARRGHTIPEALQANAHLVRHVADVALAPAKTMHCHASPEQLEPDSDGPTHFVLVDGARVVGVITRDWALGHPGELSKARSIADVARHDFVTVEPSTTIFDVMASMQSNQAEMAVVLASAEERKVAHAPVRGVLTRAHVAEVIAEGMEYFAS